MYLSSEIMIVSIPYGSIRRGGSGFAFDADVYVSIPYGSIRSKDNLVSLPCMPSSFNSLWFD